VLPFKVGLWEGRTRSSVDPTRSVCGREGPAVFYGIPVRLRKTCPKAKAQQFCSRAAALPFALLSSHARKMSNLDSSEVHPSLRDSRRVFVATYLARMAKSPIRAAAEGANLKPTDHSRLRAKPQRIEPPLRDPPLAAKRVVCGSPLPRLHTWRQVCASVQEQA
jgi:hypothetical protein